MVRAPFYDKNGTKKGAWSPEEDHKLRSYIEKFGHWNWRELPKYAGLERCGKSCRLRWMNYLRPDVKHGNYTEEEDALIMKLHQEYGNRWSMIAARLPGRTDNEIKNHWHARLKTRAKRNQTSSTDSQSESVHSWEGEGESMIIDTPPNMILESSRLSPTTSSSTEFSSFSPPPIDSGYTSNLNLSGVAVEPPSYSSTEIYEDQRGGGGDFWSEPFVADNVYNQDGNPSSSLGRGGFDMPLPYDHFYDDDSPDLFLYQMMQGWV